MEMAKRTRKPQVPTSDLDFNAGEIIVRVTQGEWKDYAGYVEFVDAWNQSCLVIINETPVTVGWHSIIII